MGRGRASEAQEDRVHPFSRMRKEAQRRPRLQTPGLSSPPRPPLGRPPHLWLYCRQPVGPGRAGLGVGGEP